MNVDLLLFHIGEALEQLEALKKEIADGRDSNGDAFDEQSLQAQLYHTYYHLNIAWASRNCANYDDDIPRSEEFMRFAAVFQEYLGAEAAGGRGEVVVEND